MIRILPFVLIFLVSQSTQLLAQEDDTSTKLIKALESIQDLKEEIAELRDDNQKLVKQIEELKVELEDAKQDAKNNPKGKKQKAPVDPLPFGSKWKGQFVLKDGNNTPPFNGVANAEVILRDVPKDEATLRVKLGDDHIWEYKLKPGKLGSYEIDSADLQNAPPRSRAVLGGAVIQQSKAYFSNGAFWIELSRPLNGAIRNVQYKFMRVAK